MGESARASRRRRLSSLPPPLFREQVGQLGAHALFAPAHPAWPAHALVADVLSGVWQRLAADGCSAVRCDPPAAAAAPLPAPLLPESARAPFEAGCDAPYTLAGWQGERGFRPATAPRGPWWFGEDSADKPGWSVNTTGDGASIAFRVRRHGGRASDADSLSSPARDRRHGRRLLDETTGSDRALATVGIGFLRSFEHMGIADVWCDDERQGAVMLDGLWRDRISVLQYARLQLPLSAAAIERGSHVVNIELRPVHSAQRLERQRQLNKFKLVFLTVC